MNTQTATQFNEILDKKGYKCLGWANGWNSLPLELKKCIHLEHNRTRVEHNRRGSDTTIYCGECKIYYSVDSSD